MYGCAARRSAVDGLRGSGALGSPRAYDEDRRVGRWWFSSFEIKWKDLRTQALSMALSAMTPVMFVEPPQKQQQQQ